MIIYGILICSVIANILLAWYVIAILKKFIFISENMADLFLTTRSFQVFIKSLHSMDTYRGEPMVQELIMKIQEVSEEIEVFREIFEYSLDEEMEEELRAVEEETQEVY